MLDHNYLASPKKLNEYQKKYFESNLLPLDVLDIREIEFNRNEILINKVGDKFEK